LRKNYRVSLSIAIGPIVHIPNQDTTTNLYTTLLLYLPTIVPGTASWLAMTSYYMFMNDIWLVTCEQEPQNWATNNALWYTT
jgi:hypothetical protein